MYRAKRAFPPAEYFAVLAAAMVLTSALAAPYFYSQARPASLPVFLPVSHGEAVGSEPSQPHTCGRGDRP